MLATCHVTISVMHLGTFTNVKATIVTLRSCKIQRHIMLLLQHTLSFFCHHSNWHHGVMSPSTHQPWQSHLKRWPQPGGHKPTSRSTLRAPESCGAWGNRARAASRQGCSAARSRSARHGTCTGTYSWGKRSVRSDRQNPPTHMHHRRELQGRKKGLNYCVGPRMFDQVIYHSGVGGGEGGGLLTNTDARPLVDVCGVFTPQPFTRVAGIHVRTWLPSLTGAHQAAGAVIQDQGHPGGTQWGLIRALTSTRTDLGPGHLTRKKKR